VGVGGRGAVGSSTAVGAAKSITASLPEPVLTRQLAANISAVPFPYSALAHSPLFPSIPLLRGATSARLVPALPCRARQAHRHLPTLPDHSQETARLFSPRSLLYWIAPFRKVEKKVGADGFEPSTSTTPL
jgi:hypothetical protein